ncbi:MAG: efflux RND transporter permease subunit, partial [bacterium]|nr:efflux RND transporter permease subunit [bacterium]
MQVTTERGPIAWMAKNSVAANLLMVFLLVGGLMATFKIKQEVFPEFSLDLVQIRVPYPSASPAEVEQGIILAIEEEVRGLDGVKQVSARAFEGMGTVTVELLLGTNSNKAHQDIKNAIDRLRSFPEDAERPVVSLMTNRHMVISLVIYGDQEESVLRSLAEHVREGLLAKPDITLVELSGVRQPEISIEVPQEKLRAYSLTLEDIAQVIRRNALEIPGGAVKTRKGEILLRVAERRNFAEEFADIPIITASDGTTVRLRDIA